PDGDTGLRLGLSLAGRIAQAHGGTLLLESRQGLTATVSLPKKHTGTAVFHSPNPSREDDRSALALTLLSDALPRRAYLSQFLRRGGD
ncbi:MAG: hypothetical protein LUE91_01725, partial [Oscillospiraceae bacterium]|nr:hypothetical protein [Oscillospiraceae bacterium]